MLAEHVAAAVVARLAPAGRAGAACSPRAVVDMKIFVIYDHEGAPEHLHHKLAITLPSKWLEQSCDKVKEAFVNAYNKKFPDNQLDDEELVLSVKDSSPFTSRDYKLLTINDTPSKSFEDKGEVRLVPAPPSNAGQPGALANGKLRCKNYGCQCEYDEAENSDTACRHHVSNPIFHDTRKWWSCCEGVKVYSIDEVCGDGTVAACQNTRRRARLGNAGLAGRVHATRRPAPVAPDARGGCPLCADAHNTGLRGRPPLERASRRRAAAQRGREGRDLQGEDAAHTHSLTHT
eukprot:7387435-Prymnesium_polylepis.1